MIGGSFMQSFLVCFSILVALIISPISRTRLGHPEPHECQSVQVAVIYPNHVDASQLARLLADILAENRAAKVIVDSETNSIYLRANAMTIQKAKDMVRQIDVAPQLRVFLLSHAPTAPVARELRNRLGNDQHTAIATDKAANLIIICASPRTIRVAARIIRQLDTGDGRDGNGGGD